MSRLVAEELASYLCGTRSGALARVRRARPADPEAIAAAHRALGVPDDGEVRRLGSRPWHVGGDVAALRARLRTQLEHPDVVDLLVFGSYAGGATTGFSDLDAVLVIRDEAAEDAQRLAALRPRVLGALREVLAFQPMQHHGFEVATPKLLARADEAILLPAVALDDAKSLLGRGATACFTPLALERQRARFLRIAQTVTAVRAWPTHPWEAHRAVSMFELLPALYLQSRGAVVAKPQSFTEAARDFPGLWWPYDVLALVRVHWPRLQAPVLATAAGTLRNPWAAIALWRRLPAKLPIGVGSLLDDACLVGLKDVVRAMEARVS